MRRMAAACLAAMVIPSWAGAAGPDLHAYWDQRCLSCHGEAGAFARSTLSVENDRLIGRHHRDDLARFLHNHDLADERVDAVMAMLAAQVETDPLFKARCGACHGRAADFARQSLALRDGQLTGLRNGQPVATMLRSHGGVTPAEADVLTRTLTRVLGEVGGANAR